MVSPCISKTKRPWFRDDVLWSLWTVGVLLWMGNLLSAMPRKPWSLKICVSLFWFSFAAGTVFGGCQDKMSFNPLLQSLGKVTEHFNQEHHRAPQSEWWIGKFPGRLSIDYQVDYHYIHKFINENCNAVIATYSDDRRRKLVGLGLLGMTVLGKKHFPLSDPFEKRIESKFLRSLEKINCNQKFLNVQVREELGKWFKDHEGKIKTKMAKETRYRHTFAFLSYHPRKKHIAYPCVCIY